VAKARGIAPARRRLQRLVRSEGRLRIEIEADDSEGHIVRLLNGNHVEEVYPTGAVAHTLVTLERVIPSLRHSLAQIRSEGALGRAA
jgi:hypothetical protein